MRFIADGVAVGVAVVRLLFKAYYGTAPEAAFQAVRKHFTVVYCIVYVQSTEIRVQSSRVHGTVRLVYAVMSALRFYCTYLSEIILILR